MGYQNVYIKTVNGFFNFNVRRYKTREGVRTWLDLSQVSSLGQGYETPLLRGYYLRWVQHLSYEQVSALVATRTGNGCLSDQHIFNRVGHYATEVQVKQDADIQVWERETTPALELAEVDIYEPTSPETLFYADGICVGEQKQKRDNIPKEGKERTTINLLMLQIPAKTPTFETIIAAEGIDEVKLVQTIVHKHYGTTQPIPIVCITDGATCLKKQAKAIFGQQVTHLLDWYHLSAKITQLMSQIAPSKGIKEEMNALLLGYLWKGNVIAATLALKFLDPKNKTKQQELIGYLEKNEGYIIDYERRQKAGKSIGSGRMEKCNDVIVAKRQKRNGMAWSPKGARNLAILTTYLKNYT